MKHDQTPEGEGTGKGTDWHPRVGYFSFAVGAQRIQYCASCVPAGPHGELSYQFQDSHVISRCNYHHHTKIRGCLRGDSFCPRSSMHLTVSNFII